MRKREIVRNIKLWLKLQGNKENHCPLIPCYICFKYFKRSFRGYDRPCPCYHYTLSYVIRRAKHIIKELEG